MSTEPASQPSDLRDPRTLRATFVIFIVVSTVMSTLTGIMSIAFTLFSRGDPNWIPTTLTEQLLTLGLVAVSLLSIGAFIAAIVMTIRVTYRMMRNLHRIGSGHASISPFWSVAFYFVPFANLVMPASAVTEIWKGTFADLEDGPPPEPNGAIAWWWGPWLIANIGENIASRMLGTGLFQEPTMPSPGMLNAGVVVSTISVIALVGACIFMLPLFGKLIEAQSELVRRRKAAHADPA